MTHLPDQFFLSRHDGRGLVAEIAEVARLIGSGVKRGPSKQQGDTCSKGQQKTHLAVGSNTLPPRSSAVGVISLSAGSQGDSMPMFKHKPPCSDVKARLRVETHRISLPCSVDVACGATSDDRSPGGKNNNPVGKM